MTDRTLPTRRREPIAMTALAWRCAELIDLCAAIKDPVEVRLGWATMQDALFEASNKLDTYLRGLRARMSDQGVLEVEAQQPTGIGDSPSVREPPPVEASPSPRERSAVEAKRPLDLCSAVSVLTSGMDPLGCGCGSTNCWCK